MNFTLQTTEGPFCYPADLAGGWGLLFYYAGDFLPVSATELFALSALAPALARADCRVLAVSGDTVAVHLAFLETLNRYRLEEFPFPITLPLGADPQGQFRRALSAGPVQKYLWLVDPQGVTQAHFSWPAETGANFTEAYRTLLALQTGRPTPAGWVPGAYTLALPPQTRKESLEYMHKKEESGAIAIDWYFSFETEGELNSPIGERN